MSHMKALMSHMAFTVHMNESPGELANESHEGPDESHGVHGSHE